MSRFQPADLPSQWGKEKQEAAMSVLVAYASALGSTREIAQHLASRMEAGAWYRTRFAGLEAMHSVREPL